MRRLLAHAPAVLVVVLLVVFALGPVVGLLFRAQGQSGAFEAGDWAALISTLVVSSGSAAWALGLGVPLAVLFYRTDLPGRRTFIALFSSTLAVPAFIWGMAWVTLASPKAGYLNRLSASPWIDVYGEGGIAFVLGTSSVALVLLAAGAALARIDSGLEEAARLSGAGPLRALAAASLPLAWPSMLSGGVLVFLASASAFGVPYMLGASASPSVSLLTTRIYGQVLLGGDASLGHALVLATMLLLLASLALGLNQWLGKAGRVRVLAGKGQAPRPLLLGRWRWPIFALVVVLALALVGLPLAAVVVTSLLRRFGAPLTWEELTVAHWQDVLLGPRTLTAAAHSFVLASGAALAVCAVGLGVALIRRRYGRTGRFIEGAAAWPYAVPGTVLAMALLVAFSQHLRVVVLDRLALTLVIGNTGWLLLIAYAGKYLALGARNVSEGLEQLDMSLAEAARVSGARAGRAFVDALLPLLRPSLVSAFLLAFMLCATELTMSVMLVPPGGDVLGTLLFELQTYADPAAAAVLACALVALVLGGLGLSALFGRRLAGGRT